MCTDVQRTIVLENGDTLHGLIIPLSSARFLVQTSELCLDLSETEIQSVDGESDLRRILGPPREELNRTNYLHEVNEDGSETVWEQSVEVHKGPGMKEYLTFVFQADRELSEEERRELSEVVDSLEYRDGFGKLLPISGKEEMETGWKYTITFDVPVAPGEAIELITKKVWPRWARKEGDEWVRRHYIGHTEGTLTTVTIKLPKGAQCTHVEPEPLRKMTFNGQEIIVWRRYIAKKEAFRPVVRYRLDDHQGEVD